LGVSYIHGDHLGSVSATSGAQTGGQTFGPWGNVTSGGSSATSRNYTGQYLDSASGLLYYHARYYDATLARFISADSVVPGQSDRTGAPNPQQLNRYSYAANNPLTYNDPSGHCGGDMGKCRGSGGRLGSTRGGGSGGYEEVGEPAVPEAVSEAAPIESWENEGGAVAPATTQMGPEGASGDAAVENPAEVAAAEGAGIVGPKASNSGSFSSGKPPHVAEVTVTRGGKEVFSGTFRSGDMTPEEAALGFPRSSLATHTEAHAVRQVPLQAGDETLIRGLYEPCRVCKGAMNRAARESGARITYSWEDQIWVAGGKK
jgi:RHS repeat-associated protein